MSLRRSSIRRLINIVAVMALVMVGFTAAGARAHGALHARVEAVKTLPCHGAPAPARSGCKDLCATHAPDQMVDAGTVAARTTEVSKTVMAVAVAQHRAAASPEPHNTVRWRAPPGDTTPVYLRHLRLLI